MSRQGFSVPSPLGQFHDVMRGIAQRHQRFPAWQLDRIEKPFDPMTP
jgi:hypothetical protein